MGDLGLGKIVDALAGALSIFDFSFLVSGSATLAVILVDICMHTGAGWLLDMAKWPGWIIVAILLLSIYICGLIAWMIGRELREGTLTFAGEENVQDDSYAEKDFKRVYNKLTESIGFENGELPSFTNKMDIYSYMWIKLDSIKTNENIKGRLAYCNRFWVMRALFEGLLFTWLLVIIVLIDLAFTCHLLEHMCVAYLVILIFFLIILMYYTAKRATSYANDQIKEIVIAYKVYILEGRNDE